MIGLGMQCLEEKSGQATYIAPLQPLTLALFPAWGSSAGAGRIRLAQPKIRYILLLGKVATVIILLFCKLGSACGWIRRIPSCNRRRQAEL